MEQTAGQFRRNVVIRQLSITAAYLAPTIGQLCPVFERPVRPTLPWRPGPRQREAGWPKPKKLRGLLGLSLD